MKKLLIISPKFFGYEAAIKYEAEKLGYDCDWFDDRPSNSAVAKAILRLNLKFLLAIILLMHKWRLQKTLAKNNYRILLIINPEATDKKLVAMSKAISGARVLSYFWDSVQNKPTFKEVLPVVDTAYSFDPKDSRERDMIYLPLFYTDCFHKKVTDNMPKKIDVSFIGTLHSDRFRLVNRLINDLRSHHKSLRFFSFFYCPSVLLFIWKKYVTGEFRDIPWEAVKFRPLSLSKTSEILKTSHFTIDIAHKDQSGLTMRTFEAAAAGCAVIGNMYDLASSEIPWLEYHDISDTSEIYTINFSRECNPCYKEEILDQYSLRSWLQHILGPGNASQNNVL